MLLHVQYLVDWLWNYKHAMYVYAGTRETYLHDKGNELELKQDETATAEVRTQEKIVY